MSELLDGKTDSTKGVTKSGGHGNGEIGIQGDDGLDVMVHRQPPMRQNLWPAQRNAFTARRRSESFPVSAARNSCSLMGLADHMPPMQTRRRCWFWHQEQVTI